MKYPWIDEYLRGKPGVTRSLQTEWNWMRYQLDGKMFAAICMDDEGKPYYITLKLDPFEGDYFRGRYEDIIPGYYMNKVHWNSVKADGNVPEEVMEDLLDKAYWCVLSSLSRKKQDAIITSVPVKPESRCGLLCGSCEYREPCGCGGCIETDGHPYHGECPVAICCQDKGLVYCGECSNFPCELLTNYSNDPVHGDKPAGARIEQCRKWMAGPFGK